MYVCARLDVPPAEAWGVADKLAAAKVPVITGAMNNIPESFASLGQRQENAGLLAKAGMEVIDVEGIALSPTRGLHLSEDVRLNYLVAAKRS